MKYGRIISYDVGNGEGVRASLFVSGCQFHCKECFNSETWEYNYGKEYTQETEDYILNLIKKPYFHGLSLLGGDPLWQSYSGMEQLLNLVNKVAMLGKTTWIWSGFTFEEIMEDETKKEDTLLWQMRRSLICACDVFVDGRFQVENKDLRLQWCGSTNQRVIDVQKTLKQNKVILYKSDYTK